MNAPVSPHTFSFTLCEGYTATLTRDANTGEYDIKITESGNLPKMPAPADVGLMGGAYGGLAGTRSFHWGNDDDCFLMINYMPGSGIGVECRMPGVEDDCVFTFDVDGLDDEDYDGDEEELRELHDGDIETIAAFIAQLTAA